MIEQRPNRIEALATHKVISGSEAVIVDESARFGRANRPRHARSTVGTLISRTQIDLRMWRRITTIDEIVVIVAEMIG